MEADEPLEEETRKMRYGVWVFSQTGLRTAANAVKLFWDEEAADRFQDEMTEKTGVLHVSGRLPDY